MKFAAKVFMRFEFAQKFFRFLLIDRVMFKKDNIVLITGKRGDGKTTLALKLILPLTNIKDFEGYYNEEVNKGVEDPKKYSLNDFTPFSLENHMAFTRKDLQTLCRELRRAVILADEAVVNAARRNSMTKANKILHEIITINRKNENTVFFCLPSIEDFDISILQYVTHWIHIDDRGLACVLLPKSKTIFGRKTWDIDKMKKVYDKFMDDNPGVVTVPYWLFDNFRGYIRFRKLGERIEQKYLDIAHEKKNRDTEEETQKQTKAPRLTEEQTKALSELSKEIREGKITDSADYYKHCGDLGFNKEKLNKEINSILVKEGEGRTVLRVIKENREKEEASYEKQLKDNQVIY